MSGDWVLILGQVSSDWSDSNVLNTPVVPGLGGLGCELVAGTLQACNGDYGSNGWLGLATIEVVGDHIVAGRAKVNDYYFDQDYYNDPNAKRHVLCQEVGHPLGLDHRKSPKARSCMNDSWGLFHPAFVDPNRHDYDTLEDLYAHSDGAPPPPPDDDGGGTFCERKPDHHKCTGAVPGNGNAEWRRTVGHDDKGRANRFEKDLGGGVKRLTVVTWAD